MSFEEEYLSEIRYLCLILAEDYIENHFDAIRDHACDIEKRLDDSGLTKQWLKEENHKNLQRCIEQNCPYILVDGVYDVPEQAGGILCLT